MESEIEAGQSWNCETWWKRIWQETRWQRRWQKTENIGMSWFKPAALRSVEAERCQSIIYSCDFFIIYLTVGVWSLATSSFFWFLPAFPAGLFLVQGRLQSAPDNIKQDIAGMMNPWIGAKIGIYSRKPLFFWQAYSLYKLFFLSLFRRIVLINV